MALASSPVGRSSLEERDPIPAAIRYDTTRQLDDSAGAEDAVDASYLADAVILLRYFEDRGAVRQAISVMKKRSGRHERTLREFRLDRGRISRRPSPLASRRACNGRFG